MSVSLHLSSVHVARAGVPILTDVALTVRAGEAVLLRGPNGAGKTTLLKAIGGLLPLSEGRITLEGADPELSVSEQAHAIGHQNGLKSRLSVVENLAFWSAYLGGSPTCVPDALARLNLADLASIPTGLLSAGQKRRAGLARLLVAPRPLWLLDEPTTSLDAASVVLVEALLGAHVAAGGLAVVATHLDVRVPGVRTVTLRPVGPSDRGGAAAGDDVPAGVL